MEIHCLNRSLNDLPGEVWEVAPFNPFYHVSNFGRVKIFCKNINRSKTYPRIARAFLNKWGYYWYGLIDSDKNKKTWFVHKVVAITFIPNPENKVQINHKNGLKWDNRVENLEWSTPLENTRHSNETGLVDIRGENNISAKLTNNQVLEIFNSKIPSKKLCGNYGVSSGVIRAIRNGRSWNHITGKEKKRRYLCI